MGKASPQVAQAIETAIQMEKEGQAFFHQAAEKTNNKLGKAMFERLAAEEITHMETFRKMFDSMSNTEDWHAVSTQLRSISKPPVFSDAKNKMKAEREPGEVEALRQAMEIERNAIEFFKDAKSKTDDETVKEIFEKIRQEEEYHHALLQAQYDSVTNSGYWLDTAEFHMDGMY